MEPQEPFHGVLRRVVQNRAKSLRISPKQLAEKLGPDYRSFMNWLAGDRKFPAELLAKLCLELSNYELLDHLERQAGRVAYHLPELSQFHADDVRGVHMLVKEVGEAIEALADTLEDDIVEKHELEKTLPRLDDVIRECARLKHWLHKRHLADFAPKRRSRGTSA